MSLHAKTTSQTQTTRRISSRKAWLYSTKPKGTGVKMFRVLTVLLAIAGTAVHLSYIITHYLSYPTSQKHSLKQKRLEFPDVSLCNLAGLSLSTLGRLMKDPSTDLHKYQQFLDNDLEHFVKKYNMGFLRHRFTSPFAYFINAGADKELLGQNLSDFVVSCKFQGRDCDMQDFNLFLDANMFNCFTFTGIKTLQDHEIRPSRLTGPASGLTLILFLDMSTEGDFMDIYNPLVPRLNAGGVRVGVHAKGTLPDIVQAGHDIPPGTSASLGLKTTVVEKLSYPYGKCHTGKTVDNSDKTYSLFGCWEYCSTKRILKECRCNSIFYTGKKHMKFDICGQYNMSDKDGMLSNGICETKVVANIAEDIKAGRSFCQCLEPCKYSLYDVHVTHTTWPLKKHTNNFLHYHILPLADKNSRPYAMLQALNMSDPEALTSFVQENFLLVNIFYSRWQHMTVTDMAMYSMSSLLSDVGGILGLWVGISMLTLSEIVVLLGKLVCMFGGSVLGKAKMTKVEPE